MFERKELWGETCVYTAFHLRLLLAHVLQSCWRGPLDKKLSGLWDIKCHNSHTIFGVLEEKQNKNRTENVPEETIAKNVPILVKNVNLQIQGAQWTSSRINN